MITEDSGQNDLHLIGGGGSSKNSDHKLILLQPARMTQHQFYFMR